MSIWCCSTTRICWEPLWCRCLFGVYLSIKNIYLRTVALQYIQKIYLYMNDIPTFIGLEIFQPFSGWWLLISKLFWNEKNDLLIIFIKLILMFSFPETKNLKSDFVDFCLKLISISIKFYFHKSFLKIFIYLQFLYINTFKGFYSSWSYSCIIWNFNLLCTSR